MRDYNDYRYSTGEKAGVILIYLVILALTAYFFYRSFIFFLASLISVPFYLKYHKKTMVEKQKAKLSEEFAEALYSVSANVKAGYALENAFMEARKDMISFYGDKSLMAEEIVYIGKSLSINRTLETALGDLGLRSGVEDIQVFAKVFETAKRSGGNIKDVIETTAETIKVKADVEKEIKVMTAEKRLDLRIMETVPFFIIAYIGITSRGYFDVLYHNTKGIIFMTACLLIYIMAMIIGLKLVKIDV